MQIIRLELDHFLKHEALKLDFTDGLNVLRGKNEAGKCVKGDTLIHTEQGTVRIDSLAEGRPEGFTELNGTVFSGQGAEPLGEFFWESDRELHRVCTDHGYTLSGTANHPLLVYLPQEGAYKFKKIGDLQAGDFLCIDRGINSFPPSDAQISFDDYSTCNNGGTKDFCCTEMSESLACVCGYLLANGSGSGGNLVFSSNNPKLQEDFDSHLSRLGVNGVLFNRGVRVSHTNFKRFVTFVFSAERFPTARHKSVPHSILQSRRETQRVFLRSLFDCDGHQHSKGFEWVTASKSAADTVRVMLLNFGVVTTTKPKVVAGYDHTYWRMSITGRDTQKLFEEILLDSLKYCPPKQCFPSKNDVIPGLLGYIRSVLGPKTQLNGWMTLLDGRKVINRIFSGTTGQPQKNMQVERLVGIRANLGSIPKDSDLTRLADQLELIANRGYFYSPVTSVVPEGRSSVYDVVVPRSHTFIANGIVSHNSSLVEAFGYIVAGSTALAKSVEDTVNWNAKSKSQMKVSCVFRHAGEVYSVVRGASGAEVSKNGEVACTGHKPVTQYLENLLGLPAGRAHHTMLSNQNEIRGVLALGPTAASEFIEKLADFSGIDQLIKRAVTELPSGNTTALEESIVGAEEALARIVVPEPVDHSEEIAQQVKLQGTLSAKLSELKEQHAEQSRCKAAAEKTLAALQFRERASKQSVLILQKDAESLKGVVAAEQALRQRASEIEELFRAAAEYKVYSEINNRSVVPADIWEGELPSLEDAISDLSQSLTNKAVQTVTLQAEQKALAGRLIASTVCPTCGHDSGDHVKAAAHNDGIQIEINLLKKQEADLRELSAADAEELETLRGLLKAHEALLRRSLSWPTHLFEWDGSVVPYRAIFKGTVTTLVNVGSAEAELLQINQKLGKIPEGGAQAVAVAVARVVDAEKACQDVAAEIAELVIPEITVSLAQVPTMESAISDLAEKIEELKQSMQESAQGVATASAARGSWQQVIDRDRAALRVARENNAFIKALKEARLKVSEKLWGIVMGGVSNYFSRLRGVPSVVIRTEGGFLVDGKAGRPSGSTLDVLGLALRIVVAKVFANSGLLVIDEPSAGCDVERTANMAAVVTSAGFDQVIWVSHDDVAEVGAANLIEL